MSLTALERLSGASSIEQTPVFVETFPSLSIVYSHQPFPVSAGRHTVVDE